MMYPPCNDCEKVGLRRFGLYKSKNGEDVCDFHQYNPEPKQNTNSGESIMNNSNSMTVNPKNTCEVGGRVTQFRNGQSFGDKRNWIVCDMCKGYGGFESTRASNGGLCGKCKGHGGRYSDEL